VINLFDTYFNNHTISWITLLSSIYVIIGWVHCLVAYMFSSISVNPLLYKIFNEVNFINNNKYIYFLNFISKVINLVDINFNNYISSCINLLSSNSATLGWIPCLVANKTLAIKCFDNTFPFLLITLFRNFTTCFIKFALGTLSEKLALHLDNLLSSSILSLNMRSLTHIFLLLCLR